MFAINIYSFQPCRNYSSFVVPACYINARFSNECSTRLAWDFLRLCESRRVGFWFLLLLLIALLFVILLWVFFLTRLLPLLFCFCTLLLCFLLFRGFFNYRLYWFFNSRFNRFRCFLYFLFWVLYHRIRIWIGRSNWLRGFFLFLILYFYFLSFLLRSDRLLFLRCFIFFQLFNFVKIFL